MAGSIGTFSAVHADTLWQPVDPTAPGLLFTDGVNWDTGFAPTDTDIATINDGSTANVVDGDAISILQLQLDVGTILQTGGTFATPDGVQNFNIGTVLPVNPGDSATYTVSGASAITAGATVSDKNQGTGSMSMTGTSTYESVTGDTWLGDGAGSVGSLALSGSAHWNVDGNAFVNGRGGGTASLTMGDDSVLQVSGNNIYLGGDGGGTVSTATLSGNAQIEAMTGEVWFGQNGSNATVILSGTASVTADGNWVAIARDGSTGTVTLNDGASIVQNGAEIPDRQYQRQWNSDTEWQLIDLGERRRCASDGWWPVLREVEQPSLTSMIPHPSIRMGILDRSGNKQHGYGEFQQHRNHNRQQLVRGRSRWRNRYF